jgi:hypothetical protein
LSAAEFNISGIEKAVERIKLLMPIDETDFDTTARREARRLTKESRILDALQDAREVVEHNNRVRKVAWSVTITSIVAAITWPLLLSVVYGLGMNWGSGSPFAMAPLVIFGIAGGIFLSFFETDSNVKSERKALKNAERAYRDFLNESV